MDKIMYASDGSVERHKSVGMFYRKHVLVIDGKNSSDDGKQEKHKLRRGSEQYAEIKSQKGKHAVQKRDQDQNP
jgi:hypothetical protein